MERVTSIGAEANEESNRYGPVVAALMFWPYGVMPIMENVRWG